MASEGVQEVAESSSMEVPLNQQRLLERTATNYHPRAWIKGLHAGPAHIQRHARSSATVQFLRRATPTNRTPAMSVAK